MNSKLPLYFSDYYKKSFDVSNRSTRTLINPYKLYKTLFCTNECKEVLSIKALRYGALFHKQFKNFHKLLSRSS